MQTLAMTHTDGLQLLDHMIKDGAPSTATHRLVDCVSEAEEAAICDDVFVDLDDAPSLMIKDYAVYYGVPHKVA